jgi:transposase
VAKNGLPLRVIITEGTRNDCTQAVELIKGFSFEKLLADRGYDTNELLEEIKKKHIEAVIPPARNRKNQRKFDKETYKRRHLIENTFLYLKRWRGIATRYFKTLKSFLAAVHIRCAFLWLNSQSIVHTI